MLDGGLGQPEQDAFLAADPAQVRGQLPSPRRSNRVLILSTRPISSSTSASIISVCRRRHNAANSVSRTSRGGLLQVRGIGAGGAGPPGVDELLTRVGEQPSGQCESGHGVELGDLTQQRVQPDWPRVGLQPTQQPPVRRSPPQQNNLRVTATAKLGNAGAGGDHYGDRMTILVRPVERMDREAWFPLWAGYNAFYGRTGPTALPAEITRVTWDRFLAADEPVHALVAERAGELIGLAHYLFHRSTITVEPTCYLKDLFTDEAARGAGVGRALVTAVAECARGRLEAAVLAHSGIEPYGEGALRPAGRVRVRGLQPNAAMS